MSTLSKQPRSKFGAMRLSLKVDLAASKISGGL